MNRDSINWAGSFPALTTPFDAQGKIDEKSFAANVDRLIAAGADGFVVAGCTGEFWTLTHEERARYYALAKEAVAGRVTLIVGTGAVTVAETVVLTNLATKVGVDGVLILPPYFVKLTDDEIFAHYRDVVAQTKVPVLLYNIPGNAVNWLRPALARRLADLENVVAIKESSGDWNNFYDTLVAVADKIRVFCGPSSIFGAPAVELGADGFVDCFPNVMTDLGRPLFDAAKNGDRKRAGELQKIGAELTHLLTSEGRTLYPATKAAMDMMGFPGGGQPRPPLRSMQKDQLEGLRKGLVKLGLLAA